MADRLQFMTALICPGCGHGGQARWEEDRDIAIGSSGRRLVSLSAGFRSDSWMHSMSGDPSLICGHCESVQTD